MTSQEPSVVRLLFAASKIKAGRGMIRSFDVIKLVSNNKSKFKFKLSNNSHWSIGCEKENWILALLAMPLKTFRR